MRLPRQQTDASSARPDPPLPRHKLANPSIAPQMFDYGDLCTTPSGLPRTCNMRCVAAQAACGCLGQQLSRRAAPARSLGAPHATLPAASTTSWSRPAMTWAPSRPRPWPCSTAGTTGSRTPLTWRPCCARCRRGRWCTRSSSPPMNTSTSPGEAMVAAGGCQFLPCVLRCVTDVVAGRVGAGTGRGSGGAAAAAAIAGMTRLGARHPSTPSCPGLP